MLTLRTQPQDIPVRGRIRASENDRTVQNAIDASKWREELMKIFKIDLSFVD